MAMHVQSMVPHDDLMCWNVQKEQSVPAGILLKGAAGEQAPPG